MTTFHRDLDIPCHLSVSPLGCFPTLWGPVRWLDQELRRRKVCPPPGTRWIWATCTRWGRTSPANSSSLLRTCSWFSVGTWAGTYPEACCLFGLRGRNRNSLASDTLENAVGLSVRVFHPRHVKHLLGIWIGIIHYTTRPQSDVL